MVLGLVSLTGLGLVGYSLWDQGLRLYPVQAICTVPLVGWGYAVYLHRHVRQRSATKPLLPTPGVMLITLALIYIVIGVATRFGGGDGDVLSAGAGEVQAASRACASQSAPPKT